MERGTLYFGFDDSNHAGETRGEIIVATYSWDRKDSVVKGRPNTRNHSRALSWVDSEGRGMVFTILTHYENRHVSYNLPLVAPYLVERVLEIQGDEKPKNINLYFDGNFSSLDRKILRKDFKKSFPEIVIDNFIKKRNMRKRPHCPNVVYKADNLANYFFSNGLDNLLGDERMVTIDEADLAKRMKLFRSSRKSPRS